MDFVKIDQIATKKDHQEIVPNFVVCRSKDIMVRGGRFYAIWDPSEALWSTDEYKVQQLVDEELYKALESARKASNNIISVRSLSDYRSKSWKEFQSYITNIPDNYHQLDTKLAFSNTEVSKEDYISKRLPYPLKEGDISSYEELISTLYDPSERAKLEWAIGAVISGDSKNIQKFLVLYGSAGAGKSTILNIIQKLFEGYYTTFEAKALGSNNNSFATEVFKSNPLVAIQHDGDLSRIEDNSKLNSIISHEEMVINEKFKASYTNRVDCFLFMATNRPVKITDAKSGIIRRLIDVKPSGRKIPFDKYIQLMGRVDFELGGIAYHCLNVYKKMGKNFYDSYRPVEMMFKTDAFFNFVEDSYPIFKEQDGITLKQAFSLYKDYCNNSESSYLLPMYKFREELKNYFYEFKEKSWIDGKQVRSLFSGFKKDIFNTDKEILSDESKSSMTFDFEDSSLDLICSDCPAQYASDQGRPYKKWENVTTTLKDIDTHRIHYIKLPKNHIVIDFDLNDDSGEKSIDKNLEAVQKWPPTYGELSKSGKGIHLHYIYDGDPEKLSRLYSDHIEIKVFTGNSSLRRKVTKCNNLPIATIDSGLPLKEAKKMLNFNSVQSEKGLRKLIERNLNKEIHPGTKPSVDFIYKILDDAYKDGLYFDVSDMRPAILAFANNSTNQADYCVKLVNQMKFKSENASKPLCSDDDKLIFFDVEVFPNLFLVNWKIEGENQPVVRMINPTPQEIEELMKFKLVGFNCRRYDNHILYARYLGYNNEQLYNLSKKIISGSKNSMFGEAYNVSYTDVYDFASAANKKSLKKFEIELGIHHKELRYDWNQEIPEEKWIEVAEYCDNDVIATEAVFNHLSGDWAARLILADIADMTPNDTTNQLSTRIIFGKNRTPQDQFRYRDLSETVKDILSEDVMEFLVESCPVMMSQEHGEDLSLLPYFPGYKFVRGKSSYRGEDIGEGGYVYAEPGMYTNVALLDIASMHPSSVISECLFGPTYTKKFKELVLGRLAIKHKDWAVLDNILNGKLKRYVKRIKEGIIKAKDLSNALKTVINSVYGLTSAKFDNPFRDPRNKDNIVAKRGELFMIDLKHAVQEKGFTVAHIKTDSIKIPNATQEIIDFVIEFGKEYGYEFEHEATYEKMCLVNDSVYIAKYKDGDWVAVGAQFAQPYVFKTLFSKEPLEFKDLCETKAVQTSLYLDMNESLGEDTHKYIFVGKIGSFCPISPGKGGGLLVREKDGKYYAATGTKGYRWLEAEYVKDSDKACDIDMTYFENLANSAIENISKYGDYEWFVSDDTYQEPLPWE